MFAYWALFSFFAVGSALSGSQDPARHRNFHPLLFLGMLLVILMVGLRYEVGGDWGSYKFLFSYVGYVDLGRALAIGDPGYQLLNWVVERIGGGLWLVNLICATVFGWGLFRLARAQPDPWLACLVAVPYLIIVVGMGYTRQAVAIGIIMAGLASIERGGSVLRFALYVAAAALFHRTAVVALTLVIFASERNRLLNVIGGIAILLLLYDLFLADAVDDFVTNYIDAEYNSQGAAIRVVMNLIPATLYLLAGKRFGFSRYEERIWRNFSLAAWVFLALLFFLPSSTVVDRLGLYITPLQVVVLSRLPTAFVTRGLTKVMVLAYSFLVLFVWLNFASHVEDWLPYKFYPFA